MGMQRGVDCRVRIDGVLYAVARWMVGGRAQGQQVANTEGQCGNPAEADAIGFSAKLPDLQEGRARMVSATFDDEDNPYAAPLSLDIGDYVDLEVFPAGLAGPSYDYGNVLIVDIMHEGQVPGLQPITVELESDGFFKFASS